MMLESFINTFIDKSELYMFKQYKEEFALEPPSTNSLWDWLTTQHASTVDKIVVNENLHDRFVNLYNFMIKPTIKPVLDASAGSLYNALQTVVFSAKDFNAICCPIWRVIFHRLEHNMLDKKFLIFSEYTAEEFADKVHKLCSREVWDSLEKLEIDMPKYDKSQGKEALLFECKLMRAFGVHRSIILT